jgi:hypothetical protein
MAPVSGLTPTSVAKIRSFWQDASFLGDADAEHDAQRPGWLEELFLDFPEIRPGLTGKALVVVGRKGSGKTAIRIAASKQSALHQLPKRRLETNASADDLVSAYKTICADLGAAVASSSEGSVQAWQRTFVYLILKALAVDLANKPVVGRADDTVRKWALDRGVVGLDWGEWLTSTAKRTLPKVARAIDKAVAPTRLTEDAVGQTLASTQFVIAVDDFDNVYTAGHRSEGVRLVQTAIEAADRLSRKRDFSFVTLYLREDLWLLCRQNWHYLDKVGNVLDLGWTDKQLKSWTERRLRGAVASALTVDPASVTVSFDEMWKVFFPLEVKLDNEMRSHGFWYLLRKTMYTPRDLQKILALAHECAREWPTDLNTLPRAEERYAEDRIDFIANEFQHLCEGLSVCLHSFAGKSLEWVATDLHKHLRGLVDSGQVKLAPGAAGGQVDEIALARFLYRIGFLEVRIPQESRYEVRDSVRFPDYWKGIRRDDSVRWAVRSAFFRYLRSRNINLGFFE